MRLLVKASILIGCLLALLAVGYVLAQESSRAACEQAKSQNEIDVEAFGLCGKVLCTSPTFSEMRGIVERKHRAQACQ